MFPDSLFFHWKCNNPSSPLMRKMAPFVGDGSTRLEPSRRKARPALNARRVLEFDIRMWTFVGGKNTRGDASVGTSAQFDWLKLSQNKYQPDVQSIFLSISLSPSHLFLSLSTSPYTTDPISAVTIPSWEWVEHKFFRTLLDLWGWSRISSCTQKSLTNWPENWLWLIFRREVQIKRVFRIL